MAHVSLRGTGNMGSAVASVVEKGGNSVHLLVADAGSQAVTGDIVILAVPYPALTDIVARRGEQLSGKVVVDITNPSWTGGLAIQS